jgi:phosphoethanolamine N-methyltransferase
VGRPRGGPRRADPTTIPAFEFNHPMTTLQTAPAASAKFDNNGQYSRTGILRYEKIFGEHYVSTGGHATTDDLCRRLGSVLRPGARVLDVGSGIGGAAFHLAQAHGAKVTGIDLAEEMVAIAQERVARLGLSDSVSFVLGDVLETSFPEPFDIIWSRDAFMHIPDKARLFSRLYSLMATGGRLVITDYARGRTPGSPEFERYIEKTGYSVIEPETYGEILRAAGFVNVVVDDATAKFVEILRSEEDRLVSNRADFLASFSASDLDYLVDRWNMKIGFCQADDMKWGIYLADKGA